MVSRVKDIDHGYKDLRKTLKVMKGSYTKVGFQDDPRNVEGESLVVVAAANEFGTLDIPERSFMRSTFDEEKEQLAEIKKAEADAVMAGRKTVETSLAQIGAYWVGRIQAKIHSHPPPPNAPSTIEKKGSSGTLVDSGQMVQAVNHQEVIAGRRS